MKIRQLFDAETSTYSYLLWDEETREAALIDSVDNQIERDLQLMEELGLTLKYTLETHIHADHVTGSGRIRERLGSKAVVHRNSRSECADVLVSDGDSITLGSQSVQVLETPGHTDTCVSYRIEGTVFTGDALLIRGCGRTDFQPAMPARCMTPYTKSCSACRTTPSCCRAMITTASVPPPSAKKRRTIHGWATPGRSRNL